MSISKSVKFGNCKLPDSVTPVAHPTQLLDNFATGLRVYCNWKGITVTIIYDYE